MHRQFEQDKFKTLEWHGIQQSDRTTKSNVVLVYQTYLYDFDNATQLPVYLV